MTQKPTKPGKPKEKNKGGRPKIKFTEKQWKEFFNLCSLQCTELEFCEWFNVDVETLNRIVYDEYGKSFSIIFNLKRGRGLMSLRRRQFIMSETNPAMAIFLGKNLLGQSDKIEHKGKVEVSFADFVKKFYKDETVET